MTALGCLFDAAPALMSVLWPPGGPYLAWLSIKGCPTAITGKGGKVVPAPGWGPRADFFHGLVVTGMTPKVALLWATLSTFVGGATTAIPLLLLLAAVSAILAAAIYGTYAVVFAARPTRYLLHPFQPDRGRHVRRRIRSARHCDDRLRGAQNSAGTDSHAKRSERQKTAVRVGAWLHAASCTKVRSRPLSADVGHRNGTDAEAVDVVFYQPVRCLAQPQHLPLDLGPAVFCRFDFPAHRRCRSQGRSRRGPTHQDQTLEAVLGADPASAGWGGGIRHGSQFPGWNHRPPRARCPTLVPPWGTSRIYRLNSDD
ncbi:LysE family transporter [Rhodovulum sulfidophilum]|uniref:LysE family transporter n=1 Tax=Rhodovulum sulfidophilum TaxID=35806 RepID=UPI003B227B77